MNMNRLVSVLMVAALSLAAPIHAVTNYSCDFETQAERDRWVLNPTASQSIYNQIKNRWYIGAPGNNSRTGRNGLYISNDGGTTAQYQATGCWVFAYDTISLDPLASGDYTIYFDYTVMANVASNFDGLYMFWVPQYKEDGVTPNKINSIPTQGTTIPSAYKNYVIRLQPGANIDYLNGTATWRQCAATIKGSKCDGTPHYLVFAWTNGSHLVQQPGAMVDNINITDNQPCPEPTDIQVTQNGKTVNISWTGTAAEYEVSAYSYDAQTWAGPKIVQGNSTTFSNLAVGQTDFIVRSKCDDYHYSLKTILGKLIYYPEEMCVDYLNLNNAVCYVNNSSPDRSDNFQDFRVTKPVDLGPSNMKSRHVVHFDRQETEPRTGGMAKTVPDGELASIRLGNWDTNDEAERIEFTFQVDTIKYPVLLLKYMPLLEAPGHADYENPRFLLDMLINGQSIGRCGQADFNANDVIGTNGQLKPEAVAQGWHITPHEISQTSDDVIWKEWTTVGVNLRDGNYQGKNLTVRLTTHDCTFSVHSGYAYFTLGCSDGKLKGMKCGQINPDFMAPDGFEYRWAYAYNERYRRKDGSLPEQYILGRSQDFHAGMQDDSLYVVDCMFVQDSTCFFSLYASTLATNPISVMNEPKIIRSCRDNIYQVEFDASPSWVQEIDHVKGDTLVSENYHIEHYEWNIEGLPAGYSSWSDEVKPTFNFPIEGGHFIVNLRTQCGTCESVLTHHLYMDPLSETRDTIVDVLCDDARINGYVWSEKPDTLYHNYGLDSIILFNEATSCDSIIYLKLIEPVRIFEDTMIMQTSLPFTYHGRVYPVGTVSMIDTVPSPTNCDSTYVLNLEVYEPLQATMPQAYVLCEGEDSLRLTYSISRGRSLRYSYDFAEAGMPSLDPVADMQKKGDYSISIPIDATVIPDVYNGFILLEDSLPQCNVRLPFVLTLQYASTVIAQRWNDVLAIKNADFNGGYRFDSVQWYVSGAPIEGATEFNYYAGEGKQLRFGEEYQALLTREDGVKLFTCAFVPAPVPAEVTDMPSLVPMGQSISVPGQGVAQWIDMLGRTHHTEVFNNSDIYAPAAAGSYLLILQKQDHRSAHHIVVK